MKIKDALLNNNLVFPLLLEIGLHSNINLTELSREASKEKGKKMFTWCSVSINVKHLVEEGLVAKEKDGRRVRLYLTKKGQTVYKNLRNIVSELNSKEVENNEH